VESILIWDTNIIIYFLNNQIPAEGMKFLVKELQNRSPALSIITHLELLSWPRLTIDGIKTIENFLDLSEIFPFNQEIVRRPAEIRRFTKISLPDAVIAATAIENNRQLITRNVKDFIAIKGLAIFNPWDEVSL